MAANTILELEVEWWTKAYVEDCDNPDFRGYVDGWSCDDRYLWIMQHIARVGKMRGGRILDVGCGFGWDAVALSIITRATVVANDIRKSMTSVVDERVAAINERGANIKVKTLTGDICTLDIPDSSFDAIVCNEMIEHVHDMDRMFEVCFRVLRPGGRMVITNDNNVWNRAKLEEMQTAWKQRDEDWEIVEQFKRERPIENQDMQPYLVMRQDIVRRTNPSLSSADVGLIARACAGMIEPEIQSITSSYLGPTNLPTPPQYSWCRNPLTGEYCDRQLDPFEVVDKLSQQGFIASVRHGFRKWPLNWLNGVKWRPLNKALFNMRAFFLIIATKPKRSS